MSAREPRFQVVHSDAGWFARVVAANGAKLWQTEAHERRRAAVNAIRVLGGLFGCSPARTDSGYLHVPTREDSDTVAWLAIPIADLDERTPPPPTPDITARAFGGWI